MSKLEELRARVASAKAEATATALTAEEQEVAALLAEEQAAREETAAADRARRADDLAAREAAARAKAGTAYLVKGIDLVSLFPLGCAPPAGQLPTRGVIVIRNPPPAAVDEVNREVEAKTKSLSSIMIRLLCDCAIDPEPASTDAITLRAWAEAYPDAAQQAAQRARELGGAKSAADKRGRT